MQSQSRFIESFYRDLSMSRADSTREATLIFSRLLDLVSEMSIERQKELLELLDSWQYDGTRKHPRSARTIAVKYMSNGQVFKDHIRDISSGGVFIETLIPFAQGQRIDLTFRLPNSRKRIKVRGQIVWTGSKGIGVEFER